MADSQEPKSGIAAGIDRWKSVAALLTALAAVITAVVSAWKALSTSSARAPAAPPSLAMAAPDIEGIHSLVRHWIDVARARNMVALRKLLTESGWYPFRMDKDRFEGVDDLAENYRVRFERYDVRYGVKKADFSVSEMSRTFRDREIEDRKSFWKNLRDDYGFVQDDFAAVVRIQLPEDDPTFYVYVVKPRPTPKLAGIVPYKNQ
jgi:cupin superfamily acireductone dioxygenase involved in methionine salvage